MHIGIDISALTPHRTGVGHFTGALLEAMLAEGGEMCFSGFSSGMQPIELRGIAGLERRRHLRVPTRLLYQCWEHLRAPRIDRLLPGIDVYHATNYFLPPSAHARTVVTLYDLTFLKYPQWCSPRITGPFSRNVRRYAPTADAILTCSESSKADIVALLGVAPERVHVTYGAVAPGFAAYTRVAAASRVAQGYGIRGPYVLFTGTLEPRKNITGLLAAYARVAGEIPQSLVLAGGLGWYEKNLDAELARLGISGRVLRPGYITPYSDLAALYGAADCFFFPSLYEGFGLPVVEAMACGCPVIASNVSSLPEVGGDAALYVNPASVEEMAETLRSVCLGTTLRERLAAAGPARAEAFSWEKTARETLAVYRGIA
ncbi:MAG: glycosyltransferase family 4 protein [Candidatus Hydrogenedentes bacterium]|nr:glycosyltransferase family 4 protein [Candidatus Hydrogenedentota bacterium]